MQARKFIYNRTYDNIQVRNCCDSLQTFKVGRIANQFNCMISNSEGLGTSLQIMGLMTIDPHSQKEHTEIHKIPKFGVMRLVLTEIQRLKNVKMIKEMYGIRTLILKRKNPRKLQPYNSMILTNKKHQTNETVFSTAIHTEVLLV